MSADIDRLGVTTGTGNGHFDQVVAFSQAIINENFKNMFKLYPELQSFVYTQAGIGKFKAEFLEPQIVIPASEDGTNWQNLYFQLRFKNGYIQNTEGQYLLQDMTNWVFTVSCDVVVKKPQLHQDGDSAMTPEGLKAVLEVRKKEIAWIEEVFSQPGDYSVERLYAKLSSAKWGKPVYKLSQAGLDSNNKPRSMEEWLALPQNKTAGKLLKFFLEEYSEQMDAEGRNSIGVCFKLPKLPKEDVKATYEPTAMMHQVYPHKVIRDGKLAYPFRRPERPHKGLRAKLFALL
ncbi:hypothetical protein ABW20_dc0110567 [Dactylellina cionopaga]|nr:hypothetical protein ABW20_dc0110567 [Dactylellina cionopaga]